MNGIKSLNFYTKNEENAIQESINNYKQLFEPYKRNNPSLEEALEQMFLSKGASKTKANELIDIITKNVKEFINPKFSDIKQKYKNISLNDAIIISSYTYELDGEDSAYNIYKILNTNMVANNRKQGISNVSKYIFLLLNSLRKLDKYYPDKEDKFLYRCITALVKLDYDSFNPKYVPYLRGKQKTFWGFTSSTPKIKTAYDFLGSNKSGTIFTLSGSVWGYDITLFNICGEEEILLEPERKFIIKESLPEYNGIIYVRCSIEDTPIVLENISKSIGATPIAQNNIQYTFSKTNDPYYDNSHLNSKGFKKGGCITNADFIITSNQIICKIENIGNNSYLNSLQILVRCESFVEELKIFYRSNYPFTSLLYDVFINLLMKEKYNPSLFINKFCSINKEFNVGAQSCSQNFIRNVLNNVNHEIVSSEYNVITSYINYFPKDKKEKNSYDYYLK